MVEYIDKRMAIEILEEEHNGICVWKDHDDWNLGMMEGLRMAIALINGLDPDIRREEE